MPSLSEYQTSGLFRVYCTAEDLPAMPMPLYVLDFQTGLLCAEFPRDNMHAVALSLCGVDVRGQE